MPLQPLMFRTRCRMGAERQSGVAFAERGVWTRAFSERPNWLRFGLPPDDAGFARLDRALGEARPLTPAR